MNGHCWKRVLYAFQMVSSRELWGHFIFIARVVHQETLDQYQVYKWLILLKCMCLENYVSGLNCTEWTLSPKTGQLYGFVWYILRTLTLVACIGGFRGGEGVAAPPFVWELFLSTTICRMVFCTPLGCCAYGARLRSRRNCYGPLFLNFLDPPLAWFVKTMVPNSNI